MDCPTEGAGPHRRVVALGSQVGLGGISELQSKALPGQLVDHPPDHEVHHPNHFFHRQLVKYDGFIDPVQKLGPEVGLEGVLDLGLHPLIANCLARLDEAQVGLAQVGSTQVGCHDQDRVAEIHRAALRVGKPTLLKDLQQSVEHVRMGFLDFVEENYRERATTDRLGQLSSLLVPDVPGRRADQTTDRVLLHVFGHVEGDQRLLVAKEELGQRLGQFGLSHPGRPQENE